MTDLGLRLGKSRHINLKVKALDNMKKLHNFAAELRGHLNPTQFGIWCNGNTTDSGPVFPGSSPGIPTS